MCNESKGEKIIAEILEFLDFEYEREKKFKDCKAITYLRFDFCAKVPTLIDNILTTL